MFMEVQYKIKLRKSKMSEIKEEIKKIKKYIPLFYIPVMYFIVSMINKRLIQIYMNQNPNLLHVKAYMVSLAFSIVIFYMLTKLYKTPSNLVLFILFYFSFANEFYRLHNGLNELGIGRDRILIQNINPAVNVSYVMLTLFLLELMTELKKRYIR